MLMCHESWLWQSFVYIQFCTILHRKPYQLSFTFNSFGIIRSEIYNCNLEIIYFPYEWTDPVSSIPLTAAEMTFKNKMKYLWQIEIVACYKLLKCIITIWADCIFFADSFFLSVAHSRFSYHTWCSVLSSRLCGHIAESVQVNEQSRF